MLGLPDAVTAGLFDLDGVLTNTAAVHDKAWKEIFDAFLRERADRTALLDKIRLFGQKNAVDLDIGRPGDQKKAWDQLIGK